MNVAFTFSVSILIFLFIFGKTAFTLRSPLTLPFILFFLWAVFGLFFTLDFTNTLHDLRGHLLKYLIVFYLLVNYFNSFKRLQILAWIVIASATIFSIGAVVQYYFIDGLPLTTRLGLTFKEMNTDNIGFITIHGICFSLLFLYKNKNTFSKILLVSCFSILYITTLLTQSKGSLLGLFAALIILCFYNKKNVFFIIITIFIMILMPGVKERVTNIDNFTKDIRIKMNRLTMEVIKEHPLAGIGFGMQIYGNKNVLDLEKLNKKLLPEYQQKGNIIASPHNTILDITVRTGVVGLALFLYVLITSFWMLWKTATSRKTEFSKSWAICLFASFMSFLIPALFTDTSFGVRAVVFYTIMAMITILWNLIQKKENLTGD